MTLDEALKLEAGSELDAIVCTAVGIPSIPRWISTSDNGKSLNADAPSEGWRDQWDLRQWLDEYKARGMYLEYDVMQKDRWHPVSSDIAAAWTVVEKIAPLVGDFNYADGYFHLTYADSADHGDNKRGCDPHVGETELDEDDGRQWSCHLHLGLVCENNDTPKHWKHGELFCATGRTAPLAICRAALKALWRATA